MSSLPLTEVSPPRDRSAIADHHKWNLAEIFPTAADWQRQKDAMTARIPELREYRGRLLSSASVLADALEKLFFLDKELSRLWGYASMLSDEDTRISRHQGMKQEMTQVAAQYEAEAAYISPEILGGKKETIEGFLDSEPRLKVFRFYLEETLRRAAHTLSEAEEKLLADAGPLAEGASNIYGILSNADFPYPVVTLSDGRSVKLDHSTYANLRAVPNRDDRQKVMSEFLTSLGHFSRTFGATMDSSLQRARFYARARKYPSTLEMKLDGPNIPVAVYSSLVDGVNRNLPTFHRYLRLRKRMLGVDELHYYDLYAPLVSSVGLKYAPEEAERHVLDSLTPLGAGYTSVIARAFTERWIDLFPSEGKRSGAYSTGAAYDVHPYILMNFNGKYTDLSTLSHELGHTMHSYFSNQTQPYATSGYATFVAEVASTFNESLLMDHMMKTISDKDTRLSLLGEYVESIKSTVFRQTQFAEFERRMHAMAQNGEPIVGESLAALYMEITKKYYGHDQGVAVVDDYVAHEWSFIPHFYSDFYVFQYATSFTASEALAAKVKGGDAEATRRYLAFLGSGGSKHPIDLLKEAGVDMTTAEPLDLTMKAMSTAMDEMERLLGS
ncbi:MAG TPA: oligoendopeptidase F [Terriglobia bacterium]|nr:oligoendopeptidase F [Terriglobia bacterium]